MSVHSKSIPLWFIGALAIMVASQLVRLEQTIPLNWILCDYAGRLGALILLFVIPAARAVAYQPEPLRTAWWETLLWIAGLILIFTTVGPQMAHKINHWIPNTRIGQYPSPTGWLNVFDLTAGLVLVACHEEIVFRRCARAIFSGWGTVSMILVTSLLFAAYHWTTGIGNVVQVFFFGVYAMLFLRRTGALWPVVLGHFIVDLINFTGAWTLLV